MRGVIIGVILGAILGAAGGFAGGLFAFPFLFPPPVLSETVSEAETGPPRASGTFVHADPSDPIHWGTGGVAVYDRVLHLGEDFEVGPGPKYHVYLVPRRGIDPDTRVEETMFVDLGRLKAFAGGQNYPIPEGLRLSDYGSVVIWCEQFNVLISPAELTHATPAGVPAGGH
jgi:hypothetical protein